MATSPVRKPSPEPYVAPGEPVRPDPLNPEFSATARDRDYADTRRPVTREPSGITPALVILGIIVAFGIILAMYFASPRTGTAPVTTNNTVTEPATPPAVPNTTTTTEQPAPAPTPPAATQPPATQPATPPAPSGSAPATQPPAQPAQPGTSGSTQTQ